MIEHLGNWHTHHVNGYPNLSGGDVATYRRIVNHELHNLDFFYAAAGDVASRGTVRAGPLRGEALSCCSVETTKVYEVGPEECPDNGRGDDLAEGPQPVRRTGHAVGTVCEGT